IPARFPPSRERDTLMDRLGRGLVVDELPELLGLVEGVTVPAWRYLDDPLTVVLEPEAVMLEAESFWSRAIEDRRRLGGAPLSEPAGAVVGLGAGRPRLEDTALHLRALDPEGRGLHLACRPVRRYSGDLRALVADLRTAAPATRSVLFLGNAGRAD